MKELSKIKDILIKTKAFSFNDIRYDNEGNIQIDLYPNYLLAEPITAEATSEIASTKFTHILQSKNYFCAIYYFNEPLPERASLIGTETDKLTPKCRSRLENLVKAQSNGKIKLKRALTLPKKEALKLQYNNPQYDRHKDHDFKDNELDTLCKKLAEPLKPYTEINSINPNSDTLLILDNAKETKNHALDKYRNNSTAFYSDIIINYLLEHSGLLNPAVSKFEKDFYKIAVPMAELWKLYPHRTFNLCLPTGVTLEIKQNRQKPKQQEAQTDNRQKHRISKYDKAIFTFTNKFLSQFNSIIRREDSNVLNPTSFLKFPTWFLLEALKNENLTAKGLNFLLWVVANFRMKNPKLFHSLRTIMQETGADLSHGMKTPLATLRSYFTYLYKCNMLKEVALSEILDFITPENIDKPIQKTVRQQISLTIYEDKTLFITLAKPKLPKKTIFIEPKNIRSRDRQLKLKLNL